MKYLISKQALADIESIWLYTYENWSVKQADRYIHLIFDEIEFIAENPTAGKSYEHIRKDYFRTKVKSHLVFYKINEKENRVEIIRILHQQMDIDSILAG